MIKYALLIGFLLLPIVALGESITYEIYELRDDEERTTIAKGIRTYTTDNVLIEKVGLFQIHTNKQIHVSDGFYIGASIFHRDDLSGFGLWIKRYGRWYEFWNTGGFSWEWFNRETENIYRKLQGSGSLKVEFVENNGHKELTSIEFIGDVTMRLNAKPWFFFSIRDTHHMVIKNGSVLRLAP